MIPHQECLIIGHQEYKLSRICIFEECNQNTRWCCSECILEQIHQHGESNADHIKNNEEFIIYLQQQQQNQKNNINLNRLKKIDQSIHQQISQLENLSKIVQQSNQINYDSLINLANLSFSSIINKQMKDLINFNKYGIQFNFYESQNLLNNIMDSYQDLQQLWRSIVEEQSNAEQTSLKQQHNFDYQNYFEQKEEINISAFQISPNEQLIMYNTNQILTVIELNTKQKVKQIKFENNVEVCNFTSDSTMIYCGGCEGTLYGYDINKNYEKIFQSQVHENRITALCLIDNYLVISSAENFIILTNVKNHQQQLKIAKARVSRINSIQYDDIKEMIVSCSNDQSIKIFFLRNGDAIIDQQNAHNDKLFQIQLTNKNNNLISRSIKELRIWQIDYQKKTLQLIRKLTENENIYGFASLLNESMIIIYQKYIKLLDKNFKVISTYSHNIDDLWINNYSNQTNTLNFVLIFGKQQINVLSRADSQG